jgi:hypothetical protein
MIMLRHILALLLLSFALIFLLPGLQWMIAKLYQLEIFFLHITSLAFNGGVIGRILRQVVTLTIIPLLITGIPAGIYWMFTRRTLPYLAELLWAIWLMLVLIIACHS